MNESYMLIGSIFYLIAAIYSKNDRKYQEFTFTGLGSLFFILSIFV